MQNKFFVGDKVVFSLPNRWEVPPKKSWIGVITKVYPRETYEVWCYEWGSSLNYSGSLLTLAHQ